jgi:hypothetical protein
MSFDARSKERLEALGRALPQKLPLPASRAIPPGGSQPPGSGGEQAKAPRHTLEREEDPAELFRVMMQASPDGTVPPHLLERLRELESSTAAPSPGKGSQATGPQGPRSKPQARRSSRSGRATGVGKEEQDLYSAFAELLLDDDDT